MSEDDYHWKRRIIESDEKITGFPLEKYNRLGTRRDANRALPLADGDPPNVVGLGCEN